MDAYLLYLVDIDVAVGNGIDGELWGVAERKGEDDGLATALSEEGIFVFDIIVSPLATCQKNGRR